MRYFIFAIGLGLLSVSCSAPHQIVNREDFLAEAIRRYSGESRERVIRAAETVLRISDPKDWDFRYTLNGFVGLRRYLVYAVLAAQQGQEKWEFLADEDAAFPNSIRASVSISEAGIVSGSYSSTPYEGKMASLPLYRLFWHRVDYMLRKRPDWVTCDQASADLEKDKTSSLALSGLCGSTSEGRDAPAPEPLPPLVVAPLDKKKPRT
jgi:hypothetical protein